MPSNIDKTFERYGFYVSRETLEKLETYEQLLLKWQKAINLVGVNTLDDVANRHFFDSAQLFRYIPKTEIKLADLGSGAGFPGLVLAMLGVAEVHLVESDVRKATFLREVSRETNTPVTIHDVRVEDVSIPAIDVISARALAPLKDLLALAVPLATEGHDFYCLFPKGLQYQDEIDKAKKHWDFDIEIFPSESDLSGKILRLANISKK